MLLSKSVTSDCSHVELLFTHVATKEHQLRVSVCVFSSAKKSVRNPMFLEHDTWGCLC